MKQNLPIVTHPDPRLKKVSRVLSVAEITAPEMAALVTNMFYTMHADEGIGLAAPQVGQNIRLIVVSKEALAEQKNFPFSIKKDLALFNPEITKFSWRTDKDLEACLSVPGASGIVTRHREITLRAKDAAGKEMIFTASGYCARVLQHEVDHLNGILYIERAEKMNWLKEN